MFQLSIKDVVQHSEFWPYVEYLGFTFRYHQSYSSADLACKACCEILALGQLAIVIQNDHQFQTWLYQKASQVSS